MRKISGGDKAPYRQVADAIRDAIEDGEFPPKSRLPSRTELVEHFAVSPMTIQHALRVLREEGVTVSRQGDGVFVREDAPRRTPTYRPHEGDGVVCELCGGVVADEAAHNEWHRSNRA
jgi:DNA-binding GntR family transcriptional regulator